MRLAVQSILLALAVSTCAEHGYFDKIIKYVNSGDYTWKAEHNKVTAMGHEAKILAGSHVGPGLPRHLSTRHRVSHDNIPQSFDARYTWPFCDSIWSIKDQGNCGTCWAVSSASVMSDRVCITSSGNTRVNISAEQLAACCTDCGVGCDGGYPDLAWPYFFSHGLVTGGDYNSDEGCQPYEVPPSGSSADQYLRCSPNKCTNSHYQNSYKSDLHYGKTAYYVPADVKSIQAEIMTNGPVVAGFTVYDDFYSYKSGVYKHVTGSLSGGHAVRVLGWGVEDGQDYWLIANSWNRTWGDNGYVKFIRGINNCGIEAFVTAGMVEPN